MACSSASCARAEAPLLANHLFWFFHILFDLGLDAMAARQTYVTYFTHSRPLCIGADRIQGQ